ncbi:MauE/DoxX family redox-associated membrane protein [Pedobacter jeongneungensis]|uniref:MauE/DoxX family redox-associated membrane protein n=1 Tax=Pedobacter jeongneungensis TaxID=947309 RepID=UPI000469449D|nr:MauE/DoxX family redox-associated membrane protein [Pedobacter jeongneungensis]
MKILRISNISIKLSPKSAEFFQLVLHIILASLFAYTAYEKIMGHERFMNGIAKVELIGRFAVFISWVVPIAELLIAVLVLVPEIAKMGLWCFLGLMIIFTTYILIALIWASKLPCHCGGVIETLTWTEHLWFNIGFILLAIIALRLEKSLN